MPELFRDWRGLPPEARGASVALGNFDGVHLGHAHVLRAAHSARPDAPLAVLTFEPHPRAFFRPDDPPFRLTLPAERAAALAALGVKFVYELPFDAAFSLMPAESFVADVLHAGLGARHLVCGADFAFGHRRGGDAAFLTARAEVLGIGMSTATVLTDGGGPISSSRIRRALQDGYPERATALLGRPWAIVGPVTHGDKRGRTIGFPTANVPLGRHLEPARGVYAVTVRLPDGAVHPGVANIGRRPTVNAGPESRLEVFLFDFPAICTGRRSPCRWWPSCAASGGFPASTNCARRLRRMRIRRGGWWAGWGSPADAPMVDREGAVHLRVYFATVLSNPRRNCGRFRLRPMNTRRLMRLSPSFHGRMKSPSAIICTAWKANWRGSSL